MDARFSRRSVFIISTLLLLIVEILIAVFAGGMLRGFIGDILIIVLIFSFIRIFTSKLHCLPQLIFILAIAVEISQIFEPAKLLGFDNNAVLSIILGATFDFYDILAYAIGTLITLTWELFLKKPEKHFCYHDFAVIALFAWLTALYYLVVIPQSAYQIRPLYSDDVNLQLFKVFEYTLEDIRNGKYFSLFVNFFGNIAVFVPVGFLTALLLKRPLLIKSLATGLLCSLIIEFCQLFLPRTTDVDDLWLNTLGAVIGYCFFLIAKRFVPRFIEKFQQ